VGLSNFRPRAHVRRLGTFRKTKSTGEVKPLHTLFTYAGDCFTSTNCFGIGPGDFATIYNVPTTVAGNPAGHGQTIAVVGDSNINPQDLVDYRNLFGLPALTLAQVTNNIIVNGPDPGLTGDETEADLDTQVASGVAPNATVLLVVTQQPDSGVGADGVDLSVLYVINNNLAPVVSKSFGLCEAFETATGNQLESALWEQASAQGISGMVSAGDTGSAACDPSSSSSLDFSVFGQAVSGDASTPFNVAVGGTDFNGSLPNYATTFWGPNAAGTQTSALSYIPEIPWNDSCASKGTSGCTATIINTDSAGLTNTGPDLVGGAGGQSNCINPSTDADGNLTCSVAFTGQLGYAKPSWQTGPGVPADNVRDLPDISLFASNGQNDSFYIICEQDANGTNTTSCDLNSPFEDFQGVGGTSASSPAFAAIMALVNQQTGQRQGNPNYVLYKLAAKTGSTCTSAPSPASTCIFYDIPAGFNNSVACAGGSFGCSNTSSAANEYGILVVSDANGNPTNPITPAFSTTAGYDLATGLGSVNVANLVKNWTSVSSALVATSTTFQLGTGAPITNDVHGNGVAVGGKVTPASGTAIPTGFVELIQGTSAPGPVIDTFALQPDGTYGNGTTLLPGTNGTPYSVVVRYGGDINFAPSTSPAQSVVSVTTEPSKISVNLVQFDTNGNPLPLSTAATTLAYGSPYILLVAVTNSGGSLCTPPPFSNVEGNPSTSCPTGTVMLFDGNPPAPLKNFVVPNTQTPTNAATLNNTGFAEDQPIQLTGGSHSITATYSGDKSFAANNTSNALSLTITPAATSVSVASSASSITSGQSVTLTAVVSSSSNSVTGPTGTVTFSAGLSTTGLSMVLGSPVTCTPAAATATAGASCTATLTTTALTMLTPPPTTWQIPRVYFAPLLATILVLLTILLWMLPRVPANRRRAYVYAMAVLFACAAAGIAGCGGGGGGGGGGSNHIYVVHGAYNGDTNYAASNSTGIQVIVQ
jgi:subtilase family serine protease